MKTLLFTFTLLAFNYSFSQNVGIGTTNPNANLHIVGSLRLANGSQGEGKVLTSNASGLATWKTLEKSIFKATGFEQTFTVAPSAYKKLTDWKTVELNVGANSIFVNAQGDLFVLKDGFYRVSAKVSMYFNDPGDSHFIDLSIFVNGTRKATTRRPIPTNDNALDVNSRTITITISTIFQLSEQDKISFEFYNGAVLSNTSAQFTSTYINNNFAEFTVEQM